MCHNANLTSSSNSAWSHYQNYSTYNHPTSHHYSYRASE